jgi:hypothetical protein
MLFRPSFCAHCGERIERIDWGLTVSRRFCQVCESEFKGQDLIPRFVVAVSLLIGLFGIGSYLKSGPAPADRQIVQAGPRVERGPANVTRSPQALYGAADVVVPPRMEDPQDKPVTRKPAIVPPAQPVVEVSEPVYLCGAQTKKGSPCSRRVKGNIRCFQHLGMPAMAAADKLKIN